MSKNPKTTTWKIKEHSQHWSQHSDIHYTHEQNQAPQNNWMPLGHPNQTLISDAEINSATRSNKLKNGLFMHHVNLFIGFRVDMSLTSKNAHNKLFFWNERWWRRSGRGPTFHLTQDLCLEKTVRCVVVSSPSFCFFVLFRKKLGSRSSMLWYN